MKIRSEIQPIIDRLDKLEESNEEVRDGVNALLEWAEECGNVIKFPLPKVSKYTNQAVPVFGAVFYFARVSVCPRFFMRSISGRQKGGV